MKLNETFLDRYAHMGHFFVAVGNADLSNGVVSCMTD
jgi:hypothetical protein